MISLVVSGDELVMRTLTNAAEGLADFSGPLARAAEIMGESELETFVVGGRPSEWTEIQEASRKARKFDHGTPPLWDSGDLAALASSTEPEQTLGKRSEMTIVDPMELLRTLSGPDVVAHNEGYAPRNLPQREFWLLQPEDEAMILQVQEDYLHLLAQGIK